MKGEFRPDADERQRRKRRARDGRGLKRRNPSGRSPSTVEKGEIEQKCTLLLSF